MKTSRYRYKRVMACGKIVRSKQRRNLSYNAWRHTQRCKICKKEDELRTIAAATHFVSFLLREYFPKVLVQPFWPPGLGDELVKPVGLDPGKQRIM